jgi:hypothetical protein
MRVVDLPQANRRHPHCLSPHLRVFRKYVTFRGCYGVLPRGSALTIELKKVVFAWAGEIVAILPHTTILVLFKLATSLRSFSLCRSSTLNLEWKKARADARVPSPSIFDRPATPTLPLYVFCQLASTVRPWRPPGVLTSVSMCSIRDRR